MKLGIEASAIEEKPMWKYVCVPFAMPAMTA